MRSERQPPHPLRLIARSPLYHGKRTDPLTTRVQVILTEEFDKSLMVLRRLMGWEMIDLTYSVMMETKKGVLRWDNQTLVDVPHFDSLPQWVSRARYSDKCTALQVESFPLLLPVVSVLECSVV